MRFPGRDRDKVEPGIARFALVHSTNSSGSVELSAFAKRLLARIDGGAVTEFTRRDAFIWLRPGVSKVEQVDPALRLLIDQDYVRPITHDERGGAGRKSSPRFVVNPNAQKAHNSDSDGNSAHCAHSAHKGGTNEQQGPASTDQIIPNDEGILDEPEEEVFDL